MFGVIPAYIYVSNGFSEYYLQLILIMVISNIMVFFGYTAVGQIKISKWKRLVIDPVMFAKITFFLFTLFALYTFISFGSLPLFSIIVDGADPAIARGMLFKGRQGIDILLLYLSAIFMFVFVPMAVMIYYHVGKKTRHLYLFLVLFYAVATLQKALILNVLAPLFVYLMFSKKISIKAIIILVLFIAIYFLAIIQVTGFGANDYSSNMHFFSSQYKPSSPSEFFCWRVIAVPIYTATDTLIVFNQLLNDRFLLGSTSSLLSIIFDMERINLEKMVFGYQFGYNELANANSYFAVYLYVNFSYIGVAFFSFIVGAVIGAQERSRDLVIVCMTYLLVSKLVSSSMIGLFLSAGFIYLPLHTCFFKFKYKNIYVK